MDFHARNIPCAGRCGGDFSGQTILTRAIRVEFFGDEIDRITEVDVLTGEIRSELKHVAIFPASHYVVPTEPVFREQQMPILEIEMKEQVALF